MTDLAPFSYGRGEARRATFRLRRASNGAALNVNLATSIYVTSVRVCDGATLPPLYAVRESGVDNWLAGLVTVVFSALNVSAIPGAYSFRVRVQDPTEEPAFLGGRVVVEDEPRLEPYLLPGIGSFAGVARPAVASAAVLVGMPVIATPSAVDGRYTIAPASAAPVPGAVLGVALSNASAGYGAAWAQTATVTRSDWTAVAPTEQLLPNTAYQIDGAGRISTTGSGPLAGTSDASGRALVR